MAVFVTIDGQTLELAGDKRADEVRDHLRRGIVDGDAQYRTVLLEVNDHPASIPKLRAFATSKRLSTTTNEGRTRCPLIVDMYLSLSDAFTKSCSCARCYTVHEKHDQPSVEIESGY